MYKIELPENLREVFEQLSGIPVEQWDEENDPRRSIWGNLREQAKLGEQQLIEHGILTHVRDLTVEYQLAPVMIEVALRDYVITERVLWFRDPTARNNLPKFNWEGIRWRGYKVYIRARPSTFITSSGKLMEVPIGFGVRIPSAPLNPDEEMPPFWHEEITIRLHPVGVVVPLLPGGSLDPASVVKLIESHIMSGKAQETVANDQDSEVKHE